MENWWSWIQDLFCEHKDFVSIQSDYILDQGNMMLNIQHAQSPLISIFVQSPISVGVTCGLWVEALAGKYWIGNIDLGT